LHRTKQPTQKDSPNQANENEIKLMLQRAQKSFMSLAWGDLQINKNILL